jgi:GT2 family glycosyltransferase
LQYSKHCFGSLREHAGCDYDHFVLDQGSDDGTAEWLADQDDLDVTYLTSNVGIARGLNMLLDALDGTHDVIVKFDNDCELTQPNTLRDVCKVAVEHGTIVSPRILGLNNPPPIMGELRAGDETVLDIPQIGGIFMAVPAWVFDEFTYDETSPLWGGDDVSLCAWFRAQGGTCGYVKRFEAWHYEGTSGQHERYGEYFARTLAEGKPAL